MSAQLDALSKALRDLPYADMLKVAEAVQDHLAAGMLAMKYDDKQPLPVPHALADSLAAVRERLGDTTAEAAQEEKLFRKEFRRKRSITIQPGPKGWVVAIPGTNAAVMGKELRHTVGVLLDQYAVMIAMDVK